MDRLHFVGVLSDADYALESAGRRQVSVRPSPADIPRPSSPSRPTRSTICRRGWPRRCSPFASAETWVRQATTKRTWPASAAVARPQLALDADFAAESVAGRSGPLTDAAIARTRAAIKAFASATRQEPSAGSRSALVTGGSPTITLRRGSLRRPDLRFAATLPTFDPLPTRLAPLSTASSTPLDFRADEISAPPPGQPAATSRRSPCSSHRATSPAACRARRAGAGLRAAAEGGDRVLISVTGISGTRGDGWAAITNAAITACLDRAGASDGDRPVRLISLVGAPEASNRRSSAGR